VDANGVPLAVGRTRRTVTPAQWVALVIRETEWGVGAVEEEFDVRLAVDRATVRAHRADPAHVLLADQAGLLRAVVEDVVERLVGEVELVPFHCRAGAVPGRIEPPSRQLPAW
jgi:hypothetical protein